MTFRHPVRVYIDCTHTSASGITTGIERVVRNIANHCVASGEELGMTCQPVVVAGERFRPIAPGRQWRSQRKISLRIALNAVYTRAVWRAAKFLPAGWQRFLTNTRREAGLARCIFGLLQPMLLLVQMIQRGLASAATPVTSVEFREGDILLLADSVWNYSPWAAVREAKRCGAQVAAIVYDIIPLTHPLYFAPHIQERFAAALLLLLEHADSFLCISTHTERQLRAFHSAQGYPSRFGSKKFGTFALGYDLDAVNPGTPVRDKIVSTFRPNRSVYLAVGTLEPRKNHSCLLQAFDQLWSGGSSAALLIVGRVGWMCEETLKRIQTHPRAGRQLFFMDAVTDTELDYCYTHARALLFPALVEGFGLPIVEALHHGLPVFASDIPVFHEVGGRYVAYFDCGAPASLAGLLGSYEATGLYPAQPAEGFTWPSWAQSTSDLLNRLAGLPLPQ
jgi:glycosyltransferase involved in cell wall biosynthesis